MHYYNQFPFLSVIKVHYKTRHHLSILSCSAFGLTGYPFSLMVQEQWVLTSLDTSHSLVTFVVVALAISSRFDELFLKVMSLSLKISFNNSFVKFSGALFSLLLSRSFLLLFLFVSLPPQLFKFRKAEQHITKTQVQNPVFLGDNFYLPASFRFEKLKRNLTRKPYHSIVALSGHGGFTNICLSCPLQLTMRKASPWLPIFFSTKKCFTCHYSKPTLMVPFHNTLCQYHIHTLVSSVCMQFQPLHELKNMIVCKQN